MTDYQRILSYLYRYEKAEKRECPGFVKAEQKAGGLRLTIQIDDERLVQGMKLKLCFYEKKKEGWQVWQLDSFDTQEHKEELYLTYSEDKLPQDFQIKGQSGIFLYYQEEFYYGSVWIGEEIPKEVLEPQRWHRVNTGEQSEVERKQETEPELKSEQKQETEPELESEQKQETEPKLRSEQKQETGAELRPEQKQEEKPKVGRTPKQMEESIVTAESPSKIEAAQEEAMNTTEGIADASREIDILEKTENAKVEETEDTRVMDTVADIDVVNDIEDTDIEEAEDDVDNFEKMWINSVKKKQPVDNIFNTAFYEGYKVSVEELRQIGKEAENLSSNQFLLKGYERYHHLLAGRVHYAGEKRYCIGVPGIYENREKYMAEIYQFPIFLSLTENRMKTGNFGYWLYLLSENI